MDANKLKNILEAGLLVAGRTLSLAQLEALFQHDTEEQPDRKEIREALETLKEEYSGRGIELVEVASGFRLQSHESVSDWVANLFQEKTPRYSRALLETLVLIAYRQPITRAEIEEVRGVAVSSNIIKILQERQWVKVLGHKEVPGRPALLGTTKDFLDYFNLKKLDELPSLADIKDLDQFDELLAAEAGELGDAENDDGDNDDGDDSNDGNSDDQNSPNGSANGVVAGGEDTSDGAEPDSTDEGNADLAGSDSDNQGDGVESANIEADIELGAEVESADDADSTVAAEVNANSVDDANESQNAEASSNDDAAKDQGAIALSDSEAESRLSSDDDASSTDAVAADSEVAATGDEDEGAPEHNETLSGPELELLRVISDFSEEHQQEVDARDEMEAGIVSKNDEDDDADVADLSQRISDDRNSGDMPEPGDTLH